MIGVNFSRFDYGAFREGGSFGCLYSRERRFKVMSCGVDVRRDKVKIARDTYLSLLLLPPRAALFILGWLASLCSSLLGNYARHDGLWPHLCKNSASNAHCLPFSSSAITRRCVWEKKTGCRIGGVGKAGRLIDDRPSVTLDD
jgi:hypothetical protein